MSQTCEDADV